MGGGDLFVIFLFLMVDLKEGHYSVGKRFKGRRPSCYNN
jgi:hypothetical protein